MDDTSLFSAHAANDGTDTVVVRVDAKTAMKLAAAWDYTHVSLPVNAAGHDLWWWDVAALRRAAADAVVHADASGEAAAPVELIKKANSHLRLVEVQEMTS